MTHTTTPHWQWDIFCQVIDNFGDIGVCWRLASDLAGRGHRVRLWVDDASALTWMAPDGCQGVQVLPWTAPLALPALSAADLATQPPDVLIEAFGCNIAPEFLAACATHRQAPVWINLEYLSAETYVERCHALPSLVQHGPAAGWTKWFFYPGFTKATGGLLREPDLAPQQAHFDQNAWLAAQGLTVQTSEKRVSLFCYEPPALGRFLTQLATQGFGGAPVHLLVAAGRATQAVQAIFADQADQVCLQTSTQLRVSYLPFLRQSEFDRLLWTCDLNFVRGEDSLVRALWAKKPFVWHIYPQDDEAHLVKLQAFLNQVDAPPSLRAFHAAWNQGAIQGHAALPEQQEWEKWQACALAAHARLSAQDDLSTRLLGFVAKKR